MKRFHDAPTLPGTDDGPADLWDGTQPLAGTPGAEYAQRRGIPLAVADSFGVRYASALDGRPAVVAPMRGEQSELLSVHARYLHNRRGEAKMLTVGSPGGVCAGARGWDVEPLIVVEGLFDALSLAVVGRAAFATIGRWAPWLPRALAARTVWIAFDANRPGDDVAREYDERLARSEVRRLRPPGGAQDWSTALARLGPGDLARRLDEALGARPTAAGEPR